MISVQEIRDDMLAKLDAEGSDHYLDQQDIIPAINDSVEFLIGACQKGYGQNRLKEENLRDLTWTGIWKANSFARVQVDTIDEEGDFTVWGILAVRAEPQVYPPNPIIIPQLPHLSRRMPRLAYVGGGKLAGRMTVEEWDNNEKNPFASGNTELTQGGEMTKYGYLDYGGYGVMDENFSLAIPAYRVGRASEIELRPRDKVAGRLVAITVLLAPKPATSLSDTIRLPRSVKNMLVAKALNFLSYKHADYVSLQQVSEEDVIQTFSTVS